MSSDHSRLSANSRFIVALEVASFSTRNTQSIFLILGHSALFFRLRDSNAETDQSQNVIVYVISKRSNLLVDEVNLNE